MFFIFFIFFYSHRTSRSVSLKLSPLSHLLSKLSQAHSLKLSPLYFTTSDPTQSLMSPSTEAWCHWPTNQPTYSKSQANNQPQTHTANLPQTLAANPLLFRRSISGKLSLSSSSTCLGFLIWVCVCIYKYRINKF